MRFWHHFFRKEPLKVHFGRRMSKMHTPRRTPKKPQKPKKIHVPNPRPTATFSFRKHCFPFSLMHPSWGRRRAEAKTAFSEGKLPGWPGIWDKSLADYLCALPAAFHCSASLAFEVPRGLQICRIAASVAALAVPRGHCCASSRLRFPVDRRSAGLRHLFTTLEVSSASPSCLRFPAEHAPHFFSHTKHRCNEAGPGAMELPCAHKH